MKKGKPHRKLHQAKNLKEAVAGEPAASSTLPLHMDKRREEEQQDDEGDDDDIASPPSHRHASTQPSSPVVEAKKVASFKPNITLSFSAGGWFQLYHFGVAQALQDIKFFDDYNVRLCGVSAGSLAVTALAGDADFNDMLRYALDCAEHCRLHYWHIFKMKDYLLASIHRFARGPMSPENLPKVMQRLRELQVEVYATKLPYLETLILRDFTTFEDVKEALCASCCFTPVVGFPFQMRQTNDWVVDGGIRNFQPRAKEKGTITINPFYFSEADIKPSTVMPVWWGLFPPPREQYKDVFATGYNDTIMYLIKHKLTDPNHIGLCKRLTTPVKRGSFYLVRDILITALYLFVGRPLAVVMIYLELFFIAFVTMVHALWKNPASWQDVFANARNIISARTFFKLWFFAAMPFNELRLSKYSQLFRVFNPIFFESNKKSKLRKNNSYQRYQDAQQRHNGGNESTIDLESTSEDDFSVGRSSGRSSTTSRATCVTPPGSASLGPEYSTLAEDPVFRSAGGNSVGGPTSSLRWRQRTTRFSKFVVDTFHLPKWKVDQMEAAAPVRVDRGSPTNNSAGGEVDGRSTN